VIERSTVIQENSEGEIMKDKAAVTEENITF
jgi:hypothetical protein